MVRIRIDPATCSHAKVAGSLHFKVATYAHPNPATRSLTARRGSRDLQCGKLTISVRLAFSSAAALCLNGWKRMNGGIQDSHRIGYKLEAHRV